MAEQRSMTAQPPFWRQLEEVENVSLLPQFDTGQPTLRMPGDGDFLFGITSGKRCLVSINVSPQYLQTISRSVREGYEAWLRSGCKNRDGIVDAVKRSYEFNIQLPIGMIDTEAISGASITIVLRGESAMPQGIWIEGKAVAFTTLMARVMVHRHSPAAPPPLSLFPRHKLASLQFRPLQDIYILAHPPELEPFPDMLMEEIQARQQASNERAAEHQARRRGM